MRQRHRHQARGKRFAARSSKRMRQRAVLTLQLAQDAFDIGHFLQQIAGAVLYTCLIPKLPFRLACS